VEGALAGAEAIAERGGAALHGRVLEQARTELRLRLSLVLLRDGLERGQEAARLQQDEPGRDREERGDLLGRKLRERADAREVAVGEIPESDGEDVELALLDELEQEVERALEALDGNARRLRADQGSASWSAS